MKKGKKKTEKKQGGISSNSSKNRGKIEGKETEIKQGEIHTNYTKNSMKIVWKETEIKQGKKSNSILK